jgi:hypothetical protein
VPRFYFAKRVAGSSILHDGTSRDVRESQGEIPTNSRRVSNGFYSVFFPCGDLKGKTLDNLTRTTKSLAAERHAFSSRVRIAYKRDDHAIRLPLDRERNFARLAFNFILAVRAA